MKHKQYWTFKNVDCSGDIWSINKFVVPYLSGVEPCCYLLRILVPPYSYFILRPLFLIVIFHGFFYRTYIVYIEIHSIWHLNCDHQNYNNWRQWHSFSILFSRTSSILDWIYSGILPRSFSLSFCVSSLIAFYRLLNVNLIYNNA